MNNQEALMIIALLSRAGLCHAKEGQAEVWGTVLQDISFNDAQEAVYQIITEATGGNTWIVPGDVIAAVRKIRNTRVLTALGGGRDPMPPRQIDPDDIAKYQLWRKTFLKALGDGQTLRNAETHACNTTGIPPVHRQEVEYSSNIYALES